MLAESRTIWGKKWVNCDARAELSVCVKKGLGISEKKGHFSRLKRTPRQIFNSKLGYILTDLHGQLMVKQIPLGPKIIIKMFQDLFSFLGAPKLNILEKNKGFIHKDVFDISITNT
jgi:hypothetical protein